MNIRFFARSKKSKINFVEVFYSKSKLLKFAVLSLLGLTASILVYAFYKNIFGLILGIIGSIVFGSVTSKVFFSMFDHKPQVTVNLEGIEDKRLNLGLIKWDEIEFITFEETKQSKWLNLSLRKPEKYYYKLTAFQRFLRKANGQNELNNLRIRFINLNVPIEDVWKFIEINVIKPRMEKGIHLMP